MESPLRFFFFFFLMLLNMEVQNYHDMTQWKHTPYGICIEDNGDQFDITYIERIIKIPKQENALWLYNKIMFL